MERSDGDNDDAIVKRRVVSSSVAISIRCWMHLLWLLLLSRWLKLCLLTKFAAVGKSFPPTFTSFPRCFFSLLIVLMYVCSLKNILWFFLSCKGSEHAQISLWIWVIDSTGIMFQTPATFSFKVKDDEMILQRRSVLFSFFPFLIIMKRFSFLAWHSTRFTLECAKCCRSFLLNRQKTQSI